MHKQNFIKIHSLFLKILITKFHQNPSICSQDIKWKQNSDINQGPSLSWKITKYNLYCSYLHFVHINTFTIFFSKSINWSIRYWAKTKFRHQSRTITLLKTNEKYCSIIQIDILSISMNIQNLIEIHKLIHKILSINKILKSIKGYKSDKNWPKVMYIWYNMALVYINAYTKFYKNSSICSEDIEEKTHFYNQGS